MTTVTGNKGKKGESCFKELGEKGRISQFLHFYFAIEKELEIRKTERSGFPFLSCKTVVYGSIARILHLFCKQHTVASPFFHCNYSLQRSVSSRRPLRKGLFSLFPPLTLIAFVALCTRFPEGKKEENKISLLHSAQQVQTKDKMIALMPLEKYRPYHQVRTIIIRGN